MKQRPCLRALLGCALGCWLIGEQIVSAQSLSGAAAGNGASDAPPEVVSRDSEGNITVRAVRIAEPVVIDGLLDDGIYARIPSITDFIQQEPREGELATEKTEVWLLFDDRNIYIAARCWDSQPDRIVANEMRRDNFNIFMNDNFAVILDTFHDRRNGFVFRANAVGGMFDGYVTDERDTNRDWNTVWRAKSRRIEGGWAVEMAIPFKSLRYRPGGSQVWGVNFQRIVRWKNEVSYLTRIPAAYTMRGFQKVSSAATLVGIETPVGAKNLEIKPYGISGLTTDRAAKPAIANRLSGDVGVDVKYGVTRSLTADVTYNTDFAQVEEDEQQVNLTRFGLFFPERRDFFLEGQGIFSFGGVQSARAGTGGGGGRFGPSDTPILFFSRRIGLNEERAVPIKVGGRLTGKAGNYSVGLLSIQTGEDPVSGAVATNFSVVRLKRDILRRSSVGVIATRRAPTAGSENLAYGVDANFSFYQNVNIVGYYARTRTPDRSGKDESYRGEVDYTADHFGLRLEHLFVGENFNPEIGFLRRQGFRRSFGLFRFSRRPKSSRPVRKVSLEPSLEYVVNGRGRLETRQAQTSVRLELQNGDQLSVDYERNFEYLEQPFDIASDIAIPAGGYAFESVRAMYQFGPQRKISGWLTGGAGSFYHGRRTDLSYRGRVELTSRVSIEPGISVNWIDLREGSFVAKLISARANLTLSPQMLVGSFIQYNSSSSAVSASLRYRWEYRPGSDLYVVYTEGRDTLTRRFPLLQNRSFVIKMTRLLRF